MNETGRSGKLIATNDVFVREMLNDPNYQILPDGNILTKRNVQGHITEDQWRPLALTVTPKGGKSYASIRYKGKHLSLHRIMYAKFVGPLESDLVINHKDGNGMNNHPDNLELDTQSHNNKDRFRIGGLAVAGHRKITRELADQIRADQATGMTNRQLREKYGLAKSTISYVVNNRTWNKEVIEGQLAK